ncbi:hypothetical protein CDAR_107461 [Caerostris darwini]|uniref:Uncharacterized protein n=1 Tax=Caerostris darwini TaxID=1538125 RepID=A0AAV4RRT7_9ARAC|nr:hypothetical protein CDAR_107461 [Caerostris darwini]
MSISCNSYSWDSQERRDLCNQSTVPHRTSNNRGTTPSLPRPLNAHGRKTCNTGGGTLKRPRIPNLSRNIAESDGEMWTVHLGIKDFQLAEILTAWDLNIYQKSIVGIGRGSAFWGDLQD